MTGVGEVVLEAVSALAQTDWDAKSLVNKIEEVRNWTEGGEKPTKALRFLAATEMEPEEIAAMVFFLRDGHLRGVPLRFYGPPGLMGAALCDFVHDKKTNTMKMVPFPEDIAQLDPLRALALAIKLKYIRTEPGVWKDPVNF